MKLSKQSICTAVKILLIPIFTGIVGLFLMALAFLLPTDRIKNHVSVSIPILVQETDYFSITRGVGGSQLDNYTDAIYLNEALVGIKDAGLWDCILSGYRFQTNIPDITPVSNLAEIFHEPERAVLSPASCRFFNGYEILIKPLLLITDYAGIRQINLFMTFILYIILCCLMMKRNLKIYILPVTLSMMVINPLSVALCMTFTCFYYCMTIPCIVILAISKGTLQEKDWLIFGITGACAFYFNMNYFQILSFGMPLVFYFLVIHLPKNAKNLVKKIISLFISWFVGYAGMMIFKWLMYAITLDHQMFVKMYNWVGVRTSTDRGSRFYGVAINSYTALSNKFWDVLEILFIGYILYQMYKNKKKKNILISREEIIFLAIMMVIPVCRYIIFSNHVIIHHWVTYRILMMSVLTFNVLLVKWLDIDRGMTTVIDWSSIEAFILDVDGTLYSQRNVRMAMLWKLIRFYAIRPLKFKELIALYYFRKLREKLAYKNKTLDELYEVVGKKLNLSCNDVAKTINKWMFEEPLDFLKKYSYNNVVDFVNYQHRKGKKIIIYSDYPAAEKLLSIGIDYDMLFVSGQKDLIEQKPSLVAMKKILADTNLSAEKIIYVGDRDDKDRISAEMVNLRYFDIIEFAALV